MICSLTWFKDKLHYLFCYKLCWLFCCCPARDELNNPIQFDNFERDKIKKEYEKERQKYITKTIHRISLSDDDSETDFEDSTVSFAERGVFNLNNLLNSMPTPHINRINRINWSNNGKTCLYTDKSPEKPTSSIDKNSNQKRVHFNPIVQFNDDEQQQPSQQGHRLPCVSLDKSSVPSAFENRVRDNLPPTGATCDDLERGIRSLSFNKGKTAVGGGEAPSL